MKLIFFGTGNAAGIPVFGCNCSICMDARAGEGCRKSTSACLSLNGVSILIDAGRTDLATLFEAYNFDRILLTHYHVDHVQGLFHLRWGNKGLKIPVHGPYDEQGCADLFQHPGILDFSEPIKAFESKTLAGLTITAVPLNHSKPTLGYCFEYNNKKLAYLTDTIGLPSETKKFLTNWLPTMLVIDCTHSPEVMNPRNHNNLTMAMDIHNIVCPEQTYLTHISHELDAYWYLNKVQLPSNVFIATDGKEVWVP